MLPLIKNKCLHCRDVHLLFSHLKSSLQKEREVGISCVRFFSLKETSNQGCTYCTPEVTAFGWVEPWLMWDSILTFQALFSMEHFDFAGDSVFLFVCHIWLLQGSGIMLCFRAEPENLEKFYSHHWICPALFSWAEKGVWIHLSAASEIMLTMALIPRFDSGSLTIKLRCYSEKEQPVLPANTSRWLQCVVGRLGGWIVPSLPAHCYITFWRDSQCLSHYRGQLSLCLCAGYSLLHNFTEESIHFIPPFAPMFTDQPWAL